MKRKYLNWCTPFFAVSQWFSSLGSYFMLMQYTLTQKRNSSPFHLQILKWPDGVQERAMSHYLPVLHLVILKFANEKVRSFFFEGVYSCTASDVNSEGKARSVDHETVRTWLSASFWVGIILSCGSCKVMRLWEGVYYPTQGGLAMLPKKILWSFWHTVVTIWSPFPVYLQWINIFLWSDKK